MNRRTENSSGTRTLVSVWRYRVHEGKAEAFIRDYGPEGAWVSLFRRANGYVSTELLRDAMDPAVFATIDRWESRAAYDLFRRRFADEYLALDSRCASYTESEELLLEGNAGP